MALINGYIQKQFKVTNEALVGLMGVVYEMALMLIKFEGNDVLFKFIEEYQKNIIVKGEK